MSHLSQESIIILLIHYRFDLGSTQVETLASTWIAKYDRQWIVWAIVEAIYQQRYKSISVDRMLSLWLSRGHPSYHVPGEYERQILQDLQKIGETYTSDLSRNREVERNTPTPNIEQFSAHPPPVSAKFDPDVTPAARFYRHQSLEPSVFDLDPRMEIDPNSSDLNPLGNDQSVVPLFNGTTVPHLPQPIEDIIFDDNVSPFFHRLKHIAGDNES
jgi:hypothetical protein